MPSVDPGAPPLLEGRLQWRRGDFRLDVELRLRSRAAALFGPSGAGKSTILGLIAGLALPDGGWLRLTGESLGDGQRWLPPEARRVATVFQDGRLFPHLSVAGNLRYGLRRARQSPPYDLDAIVRLLDLGTLLARRPRALSGGEKQRVNLGRALLAGPRLLVLDEPFAGLDDALRATLTPFLERVREQLHTPYLLVSHDFAEVERLCTEVVFLENGAVLAAGPVAEALAHPAALRLAGRLGLSSLLEAAVVSSGPTGTHLTVAEQPLFLPEPVPPGTRQVFVRVRPEEVLLARTRILGTSAQNQLRGRIARLDTLAPQRCMVTVDLGHPLRATITQAAVEQLGLAPGTEVHCLLKSVALRQG